MPAFHSKLWDSLAMGVETTTVPVSATLRKKVQSTFCFVDITLDSMAILASKAQMPFLPSCYTLLCNTYTLLLHLQTLLCDTYTLLLYLQTLLCDTYTLLLYLQTLRCDTYTLLQTMGLTPSNTYPNKTVETWWLQFGPPLTCKTHAHQQS